MKIRLDGGGDAMARQMRRKSTLEEDVEEI
jgi:hypothetical protein